MTTWSTVVPATASYSTITAASNSYSTVTAGTSTYIDIGDLSGYVEAGYLLDGYISGDVWTVVPGVSSTWTDA